MKLKGASNPSTSVTNTTSIMRPWPMKTQRIQDALSSLVDALIPTIPDEDEADADERHDNAVDLARSILDRWALH
jgi:hypothetical protein